MAAISSYSLFGGERSHQPNGLRKVSAHVVEDGAAMHCLRGVAGHLLPCCQRAPDPNDIDEDEGNLLDGACCLLRREVLVDDFDSYVAAAWPRLLRSAWVLTGDWHRAEDLVQTVLARAYGRWPRLRDEAPDAYLRTMLATTYLTWSRRRWRSEVPTDPLPQRPDRDVHSRIELQETMRIALAALPRQQRAVLMLRFHADLTEAATARALGIGVGTVKSYTARAIAALRDDPSLRDLLTEENQR
jgi:RNA polymerase sigma-70 factor (sigma-E family)